MLTEDEVARHCHPRAFQRGLALATRGQNILTRQCRYPRGATVLSAFVASSAGWSDRYRTSVTLDGAQEAITDYSCTCPAAAGFDGMCKHAAALALSFMADPEGFLGYEASRAPRTSPSLSAYLDRARRASHEALRGEVDVEPTLSYAYGLWSARFRVVGPRGGYVLRSLSEFAAALRTGETVSYGPKLSFAHVRDAFTDHGWALALLIERAATSGRQGRARGAAADRALALTDDQVVALLDLQGARTTTLEGGDGVLRRVNEVSAIDEDPAITLRLRPEGDGYVIMRDEPLVVARSGERAYVVQDDLLYRCTPAFAPCAEFLATVYASADDELFVSRDDLPLFCAEVLPRLEEGLAVSAPAEFDRYRPVPCALEFRLDRDGGEVSVLAHAVYGDARVPLAVPPAALAAEVEAAGEQPVTAGITPPGTRPGRAGATDGPLRDEAAERRACDLLAAYFRPDATLPVADGDGVERLLFGGLARLQALGDVFTTPAFDRLLADGHPRVSVGLSLHGSLLELDVSSADLPPDELAALLDSYRQRRRYHRLADGSFLSLEAYDLSQLEALADDLGLTSAELASGAVELPAWRAFYLDEALPDARRDGDFRRYVEGFRAVDPASYPVPDGLAATLRPYQREGFGWLMALADLGLGGILADEMGLGKSVQLIALLVARADELRRAGGTLIVCPASLVYNWTSELRRFAPGLVAAAVTGSRRDRDRVRAHGADVLVTSYDLLRRDADAWEGRELGCVVLDEAQYIKNQATLTARAARRLTAGLRLALTGTPVENRLSELWSVMDFLMPGLLGSYASFSQRFEAPILGREEEPDDDEAADAAARLAALVGPFVLRRLKRDVLPELPEKMESTVLVPLRGEQAKLYAAHEQRLREELAAPRPKDGREAGRSKVEVLAELTRLRQLCCDPALVYENFRGRAAKMDAIMDLVAEARDGGQKALLFSQFTTYLSRIAERLDRDGVPYYVITGATPKKRRLELVEAFNADDTPVFLISLRAGGTGLNLTGASVVIHADPWWNGAAEAQAADRAHRIGQTRAVSVYRVIAEGTVEERILRLQERKADLADAVIAPNGAVSLANLTAEDLLDLLEG
ncbi:MAG: serine/threonine protein kinase [Eggerthellaceae bacterium]|nr:serine/threonine protein kinase [Eggerthellaceae bacterium]